MIIHAERAETTFTLKFAREELGLVYGALIYRRLPGEDTIKIKMFDKLVEQIGDELRKDA